MATFEPPLELLAPPDRLDPRADPRGLGLRDQRRLLGARALRRARRRCVGGDPRFVVSRSPRRLGFYRNFERALALAPARRRATSRSPTRTTPGTRTSSRRCCAELGDARLVYSDARVVGARRRACSPDTYWSRRAQQPRRPALAAGREHGHRRRLAVPARRCSTTRCPSRRPSSRTSTTTGSRSCALATRRDRLRRPAALRLRPARRRDARPRRGQPDAGAARAARRAAPRPARADPAVAHALLRRRLPAAAVRRRSCGCAAATGWPPAKRRALDALRARRPLAAAARRGSAARGARELRRAGGRETLGAEWMLLPRASRGGARWRRPRATAPQPPRCASTRVPPPALDPRPGAPRAGRAGACARSPRRSRRCGSRSRDDAPRAGQRADPDDRPAPLLRRLHRQVQPRAPARGARPARAGRHRRPGRRRCRATGGAEVEAYSGLGGAVRPGRGRVRARVARASRSAAATASSPRRGGRPTSPTRRARELGGERFLYLIQEYEPFTFPMGSLRGARRRVLPAPPHRAVLDRAAARLLPPPRPRRLRRGRRRATRLGLVPERDHADRRRRAPTSWPARRPRRLLFYARPEPHAARNMFELGVLALAPRGRARRVRDGWELHGIGTVRGGAAARPRRRRVARAPAAHRPGATTRALLREHDVGLALMYTPHPSLVPIEMASAGMLTVTNTFENKTAEALAAISPNLIAAEPTIDGVAGALVGAAAAGRRTTSSGARRAAASPGAATGTSRSATRCSTRWSSCFNDRDPGGPGSRCDIRFACQDVRCARRPRGARSAPGAG